MWSPTHTHWSLGLNLALIHTEHPSGRIPSSVCTRRSAVPIAEERKHNAERGEHKGKSCPNVRLPNDEDAT